MQSGDLWGLDTTPQALLLPSWMGGSKCRPVPTSIFKSVKWVTHLPERLAACKEKPRKFWVLSTQLRAAVARSASHVPWGGPQAVGVISYRDACAGKGLWVSKGHAI